MSNLHAFVDNEAFAYDSWNTPKDRACGECGVPFGVHGSFGKFDPPSLDEVLCQEINCPHKEVMHTIADHAS